MNGETGIQRAERIYRVQLRVESAEAAVVRAAVYFETHPMETKRYARLERAVERLLKERAALRKAERA